MNCIDDFRSATWDDVRVEVVACWPSHYWGDRGAFSIDGWLAGLANRGCTPALAMLGLRVSTSKRVPACGELIAEANAATGPPTVAAIQAAERLHLGQHLTVVRELGAA